MPINKHKKLPQHEPDIAKNEKIIDKTTKLDKDIFTVVQSRRQRKHFVKGTNNDTSLKAVERKAWIFATNLERIQLKHKQQICWRQSAALPVKS